MIMLGLDMLVCGSCSTNFPLTSILAFMQHKKFDCDITVTTTADAQKILFCQSCPEKFITPWSLLQHAQHFHSFNIYAESGQCCSMQHGTSEEVSSAVVPLTMYSPRGAVLVQQASLTGDSQVSRVPVQIQRNNHQVVLAVADVPVSCNNVSSAGGLTVSNHAAKDANMNSNVVPIIDVRKPAQSSTRTSDAVAAMLALHRSKPETQTQDVGNNTQQKTTVQTGSFNHVAMPLESQMQSTHIVNKSVSQAHSLTSEIAKTSQTTEATLVVNNRHTIGVQMDASDSVVESTSNNSSNSSSVDIDVSNEDCDTVNNSKKCEETPSKVTCDIGIQTDTGRRGSSSVKASSSKKKDGCCDRQECGITVMPGTHEKLEKCCVSVVPKKRKRHMETKHMHGVSKNKKKSMYDSERQNTLYIDVEASMLDENEDYSDYVHTNQSETDNVGQKSDKDADQATTKTTTKTSERSGQSESGGSYQSSRSVILHPGMTYSIPVSYGLDGASLLAITTEGESRGSPPQAITLTMPTTSSAREKASTRGQTASGDNSSQQRISASSTEGQKMVDNINAVISVSQGSPSAGSSSVPSAMVNAIHVPQESMSRGISFPISFGDGRNSAHPLVLTAAVGAVPSTSSGNGAENDENSNTSLSGSEMTIPFLSKKRRYPTSRPYKCDQCDNSFNQRIHLKKHQSKHTGIKPYKCEQCDYSTVERSHLKVHIRVHTGEKPFKCTYCEYATTQNSTLKIHLRRHHGTSAFYNCQQCGMTFTQPALLTDHARVHDPESAQGMSEITDPNSEEPVESVEPPMDQTSADPPGSPTS